MPRKYFVFSGLCLPISHSVCNRLLIDIKIDLAGPLLPSCKYLFEDFTGKMLNSDHHARKFRKIFLVCLLKRMTQKVCFHVISNF